MRNVDEIPGETVFGPLYRGFRIFAERMRVELLEQVLPDKESAQERLLSLAASARRHQLPLSVVIIRFVNGVTEHFDAFTTHLKNTLRSEDLASVWTTAELLLVLPVTDLLGAYELCQRLRLQTSGTASFGIAQGDEPAALISAALRAVQAAVDAGGDAVMVTTA